MPRGRGTFRRVVAGLLALLLLALPGPAMRHGVAATLGQRTIAEHCVSQTDAATLMQATLMHTALGHTAVSAEGSDQPGGRLSDKQGLPCCVAAQCPSAVGALLYAQAGSQPSPSAIFRYPVPAQARFGIRVPPSLPPPRQRA
jgi:hypothetical protein